jgi:hypothetical protein
MGSFKKYQLIMFDTFAEAKASKEQIAGLSASCGQVNLVIREEGNMEDVELLGVSPKVKIFAGKAWALIHDRRKTDGWYDEEK